MLNKIENILSNPTKELSLVLDDDLTISIRPFLTIKEEISFVNEVLDNSFIDGVYSPTLSDIAFKLAFIDYFTNIPMIVNYVEEEDGVEYKVADSEKMYEFCNKCSLFDKIMLMNDFSFCNYYERIKVLINDAIEFKKESVIASSNEYAANSFGEVCDSVAKLVSTLNTAVENGGSKIVDKIVKSISAKNLNKLFSLLPEDTVELINIMRTDSPTK